MAESLVFDTDLNLNDLTNYRLEGLVLTPPKKRYEWITGADVQGGRLVRDPLFENREITVRIRVEKQATMDAALAKIAAVSDKLEECERQRDGLPLVWTPDGATKSLTFHVLSGEVEELPITSDDSGAGWWFRFPVFSVKLIAKPAGHGTPVLDADHVETTLPCLIFTVADIPGDLPALGKLVIDEDDGDSQWFLQWAVQSRHYSSATTAKLFYEAEALTALGTAAIATVTGASGGGSNNAVTQGTLTPDWAALLSTQAVGGGAHMSHVGSYRVFARVQTPTANTGAVQCALEWGEGDFRRFTRNAPFSLYPDDDNLGAWEGTWRHVDLGLVHLSEVAQGTQRWEGRIVAKSTVTGDDLIVDCLYLFPVDEAYGVVRGLDQFQTVTAFSARDEFNQSAGALAGKTAPVGGVWAGAGDADDFTVETTGKTAQRTAVSDANSGAGRFAISGAAAMTACLVQVDMASTAGARLSGPVARYTDTSNFLLANLDTTFIWSDGKVTLSVDKVIAGAFTTIGSVHVSIPTASAYWSARLLVDAAGRWSLWWWEPSTAPPAAPILSGVDTALATGGALASGKPGFYDVWTAATANTRNYDNFFAAIPVGDAAVFASQSIEIRHDRVIREDSGGTIWTPPSKYEGDYLMIPPAGREDRTARIIVKASRNDPDIGADSAIDDISARLTYTPRHLVVPE